MDSTLEVGELKKIKLAPADICKLFKLQTKAQTCLQPDIQSPAFVTALVQATCYLDVMRFFAYGLPKREAIWWSYLCATDTTPQTNKEDFAALVAVKKWVYTPNEDNRRETKPLAKTLNYKTAASWSAMAVFWSGGSLTPAGKPEVLPSEQLTAHAVAGAVLLAAVEKNPEQASEKYLLFLQRAIDIANGGNGVLDGNASSTHN